MKSSRLSWEVGQYSAFASKVSEHIAVGNWSTRWNNLPGTTMVIGYGVWSTGKITDEMVQEYWGIIETRLVEIRGILYWNDEV